MAVADKIYQQARVSAIVVAAIVAAGGALALLGWLFGIPVLKSFVSGLVPMNPVTALSFVAAAGSLALFAERGNTRNAYFAMGLAGLVAAVGILVLGSYWSLWELRIDRALFRDQLGDNRMAPNTAVYFVLVGLSLLTIDHSFRGLGGLSQVFSICVVIGSGTSLLGYGYGTEHLYGIGSFIPMALNTTVLFASLATGLMMARPERSVFAVLASQDAGGVVARRLLPAAIVIPIVLGVFRLAGQRAGLYGTEFGASLMVVVTVVLLVAAILVTAVALNHADAQRRQAEATTRLYADVVRHIPIGVNIFRLENLQNPQSLRFVNANPAAAALLGVDTAPLLGRTILEAFPALSDADLRTFAQVAQDRQCREIAERLYGDDQVAANVWSIKAFPLPDHCVGTAFENISQRKAAEKQIHQLNQELEQRVAERTAELGEANRDLRQKNQENEMFVYSVSHDLRSPLVSLQGFSKELSQVSGELRALLNDEAIPASIRARVTELLDGDMHQSLHFIQTAALRLGGIIEALLQLSRVGRIEYARQALDMNNLLTRVVESLSAELFDHGVEVQVKQLPSCLGDSTAIEQVFANLISNAVKYRSPQRSAVIEVGLCDETAENHIAATAMYYVKDNGLGIPVACREKIFQAFQRAHPHAAPGDGMGLAIVRRIVERHGGRVWVESNEGEGSTFFIALPVAPTKKIVQEEKGDCSNGTGTNGHLVGGRR